LRLLVTGASGLLGHKVIQFALADHHEVHSIYREHKPILGNPIKLDLADHDSVSKTISALEPDAIIHTAAYTDVDGCEINREMAWRVNAEATRNLALASSKASCHLTYVSTDYVFDGDKGLYSEEEKPNPISYYGYTKLKGEDFAKEHAKQWCIARPSVIYGWSQTIKLNFATWLLSNLSRNKEVKVLVDQHVSPTLNTNLAKMLVEIAERNIVGTLHTAGANRVSRHEFALRLAEIFNLNRILIKPSKTGEMMWRAKRPKDSSLNVSKASELLNNKPMELKSSLQMMKREASGVNLQNLQ